MKYITVFLVTTLTTAIVYFSLAIVLSPAPIVAEYWVREMMVIKQHIAKEYDGQKKIIIASGSNSLFGIDAKRLGEDLGIPVINFGLHAGLPLATILNAASSAAKKGDVIILPLESEYYQGNGLTAWQVRNAIAWDHAKWNALPMIEKIKAIGMFDPTFLWELIHARYDEEFDPDAIKDRLLAMDDRAILARFKTRTAPVSFSYSAFNLDSFGDMEKNDGAEYTGNPTPADLNITIRPEIRNMLKSFIARMVNKGARVYFANVPWVATPRLDNSRVETSSMQFHFELSNLAPVLDTKAQLVFKRDLFFNTDLHLNARGRKIRTEMLANSIRRNANLIAYLSSK